MVRKQSAITDFAAAVKASTVTPSIPSSSSIPKPGVGNANIRTQAKAPPGVKTLSSYLDVEKISQLPTDQISQLWRLRHASNERSLAAVIPTESWNLMMRKARNHPQFLLPLPRSVETEESDANKPAPGAAPAAEMHFLQWTFPHSETTNILFTHLAEYKLRGEFSQPHTTISAHTELADSNGVVLIAGTVMQDRGVSVDDGRWLLMCMQKFYGMQGETPERQLLLERFTSGDAAFRVEDLIEQADQVS